MVWTFSISLIKHHLHSVWSLCMFDRHALSHPVLSCDINEIQPLRKQHRVCQIYVIWQMCSLLCILIEGGHLQDTDIASLSFIINLSTQAHVRVIHPPSHCSGRQRSTELKICWKITFLWLQSRLLQVGDITDLSSPPLQKPGACSSSTLLFTVRPIISPHFNTYTEKLKCFTVSPFLFHCSLF